MVERTFTNSLTKDIAQYINGAPIRDKLIIHQINGQAFYPAAILYNIAYSRRKIGTIGFTALRTIFNFYLMLCYLKLYRWQIKYLSAIVLPDWLLVQTISA